MFRELCCVRKCGLQALGYGRGKVQEDELRRRAKRKSHERNTSKSDEDDEEGVRSEGDA